MDRSESFIMNKKGLYLLAFLFLSSLPGAFARDQIINLTVHYKSIEFAGKSVRAIAVNDQIPAPMLRFKEGDRVTIHVHNQLDKETTIHWHGLLVPWNMDGVEHISQLPIPAGGSFQYQFTIKQSGTYWYHAHAGFQEQQGLYGGIIIDPSTQSPYKYTKDYVIVLSDWSNSQPEQIFANLKKDGDYYSPRFPLQPSLARFIQDYNQATSEQQQKLLADYKMMQHMRMSIYDISDVAYDAFLLNGKTLPNPWTAQVQLGDIVRLRFIGAAGSTIFRVKIPGASMQIVHIQGNDVIPNKVDDFVIAPGETYDVLVKIDKTSPYIIYAESADTLGAAYGALVTHPQENINYKQITPFPTPEPVTMGHGTMNPVMAENSHSHMMAEMHATSHGSSDSGPFQTIGTKYQDLKSPHQTNDPDKPVQIIKMVLSGYMD